LTFFTTKIMVRSLGFDYDKAIQMMTEAGLDALIAVSPENVLYTSGCLIATQKLIRNRLAITVLPKNGEPVFVVCNIEERYARRESWIKDVRAYREHKTNPVDLLADVLKEKGLQGRRLGIDKMYIQAGYYQRLIKQVAGTTFEGSDKLFARMQMVKSPEEIDLLQKAAIATEKSIHAGFETSGEGKTERSIALNIAQNMMKLGVDHIDFLEVYSGKNTLIAQPTAGDKKIKKGDVIKTDIGGVFSGYFSDIARMAVVGEPSDTQKEIYCKIVSIQREVIDNMRPGVRACDLYNLCKKRFHESGLGPLGPHIGHGLGIMLHEEPIIHPFNEEVLKENMVICIEPPYWTSEEGYHIEDLVTIIKDGSRILSNYSDIDEMYVIQ